MSFLFAFVLGVKFQWVGRKKNHKIYITEDAMPRVMQELTKQIIFLATQDPSLMGYTVVLTLKCFPKKVL